jgi:hypothetical protein
MLLWVWTLEASHYGCPSGEAVRVHGQRFGLWAWPLEASHYARPKAPLTIFYWLCNFSSFLWTLNKVWPLNPTASRLGRPQCEAVLIAKGNLYSSDVRLGVDLKKHHKTDVLKMLQILQRT